ncbi:MAG: ComEC/Rec2 family competence protein [Cetobacterium sp.]
MKRIEIGAIILVFASIFFLRLNYITFRERVEVGDIVQIVGRVDADRGKVETINNKYSRQNIYFSVDRIEDGEKIILGEITKIKISKWGITYYLKAEEVQSKDNRLRVFFRNRIERMTKDYSIGLLIFLKATLLGEGYLLDDELKDMFRYTGTAHILVISGLHIGVIISGITYMLLKLKISKRERYILTLLVLTLYVFGIGKSPSVFRAYIMGSIYILSNILYEKADVKKSFFVAFIISLLVYPAWVYTVSFWMSYVAVFSIVFIYEKIPKVKKFRTEFINTICNTITLSLTIQLCMTPIFYIFFKNIPIFSFFSNVILIPIASVFIVISFLTLFLSNLYLEFLTMPILNISYLVLIKIIGILNEIPYLTFEL